MRELAIALVLLALGGCFSKPTPIPAYCVRGGYAKHCETLSGKLDCWLQPVCYERGPR